MKTLKQVCESIDPKLKDQLISFINSNVITDEIARKMLHMTVGGESLENLRKILSSKGIEECSRTIGFIVQDYGQLKDVLDVLNNESKQITGDDVLNSKNKNIYKLLSGTGLNEDMLKEIAGLKIENKKSINRGKYEILLILFINNMTASDVGDMKFKSGSGEWHLEVKCDKARICNQKVPNFEQAENFLRNLIRKLIGDIIKNGGTTNDIDVSYFKKKNLLGSQSNVMKTSAEIQKISEEIQKLQKSLPKLDVFDVLVRTLNAQYSNRDESPEEILGNKYGKIKEAVYKNDKIDTKQFVRLMMAIQLRGYLRSDVFDKLMLVDEKSGNYIIIDADEIESLDTFDNDHIKVVGIGGTVTGAYRENFCQISYM